MTLLNKITDSYYNLYTRKPLLLSFIILFIGLGVGFGGTLLTQSIIADKEISAKFDGKREKLDTLLKTFDSVNVTKELKNMKKSDLFSQRPEFILYAYDYNKEGLTYLNHVSKYKDKGGLPVILAERKALDKYFPELNMRDSMIEVIYIKEGSEVNRFLGNVPLNKMPKSFFEEIKLPKENKRIKYEAEKQSDKD